MIYQLILVALAISQASAAISECYWCSSVTSVDASDTISTTLATEVATFVFASTTGNCYDPELGTPGTTPCNSTSFCSTTVGTFTLTDSSTDDFVTLVNVDRGCQEPETGGSTYEPAEADGNVCYDELDRANPYYDTAVDVPTANSSVITVVADSYYICLCNDESNCNANAGAGQLVSAFLLVIGMALFARL